MATTPRPYVWKEAELINNSADETGATFHFYDTYAQMIYPNSGLKYKYGTVPDGHWEELNLSAEGTLEATDYEFVKGDHPATGSLYFIGLRRTGSHDTLYLFRYDYERDVSELVESADMTIQNDNPITQLSAKIKNVQDSLFTKESSLFTPTSKLLLGIAYGRSMINTLMTGYMDEVEWKFGSKTVSLSGRNSVGYFLNSQTFDEDHSYSGTAASILEDIFTRFGITDYEIDDSDSKKIEFEVSANDTGLKAIQLVCNLMSDIVQDKIWDIEEMFNGKIIVGLAEFRADYIPKGIYTFHGKNDVFASKITRSIDGSYSHVRCTGTDKSNHDLTPQIKPIETWRYWSPAEHRTYHAPKADGLADSNELEKYCQILADQLQKSGQTVTYKTSLRPQLLVGDVAKIEGDEENLGIITEIKHSFGEKGYLTEFTAASGGVVTTINNKLVTKRKSVDGTDRTRRMSDFFGNDTIPTQESNNPTPGPQSYITQYDYAHMDGQGYIELPFKVSDIGTNVWLDIQFELDSYVSGMCVFGNETSDSYAHLKMANDLWSTSSGSAAYTFTAPFGGNQYSVTNYHGVNTLSTNGVRKETGYYTASGYDWKMYLGHHVGAQNFQGKIRSVRLVDFSEGGGVLVNMYPAVEFSGDGIRQRAGLYDSVSKRWFTCAGMIVDQTSIKEYDYAHFSGAGHIELPITIHATIKYTIWFHTDEMVAGMAVFGNSNTYEHAGLVRGQNAGDWLTSDGSDMASFSISTSDTRLGFTMNHNSANWMFYDNANHQVTTFTADSYSDLLWIGGSNGHMNFKGDFERLQLIDLSDNTTAADFVPAEEYYADGRLKNRGIYDKVNKLWYTCSGLTVHN